MSAIPSVICVERPDCVSYTNTACNCVASRLVYAIQRESGLQRGSMERVGTMYWSLSALVALPVATSTIQSRRCVSVRRIFLLSGDQAGV